MYCAKCYIHNDGIQCRGCFQYLIADTRQIEATLLHPPVPSTPIDVVACVAHWGDTFAALSHARQVLTAQGLASCRVLYLGPDALIAEWVAAQPWVSEVRHTIPGDNYKSIAFLTQNRESQDSVDGLLYADAPELRDTYPPGSIWWGTIPNYWHNRQYAISPLEKPLLPAARVKAAKAALASLRIPKGARAVLLHPSSTWSASAAMHWPHWAVAVPWLLENTPHHYILTGLNEHDFAPHPRLHDLIGQLPSNMENLAMAGLCGSAVTTCNSVSLWTVMQGIPALVLGNGAIASHINPFRRFIDRDPNCFLPVESSFEQFTQLASTLLA